jgi:hypothetical protein
MNPRRKAGDTTEAGRARRLPRRNHLGRCSVSPHFSFHRQGSYAEANGCRKPLQVVRFGGYGLLSQFVLTVGDSGLLPKYCATCSNSPPGVPDSHEEPAGYQLLNSRRKAAPGAERPAGSLEVGKRPKGAGCGGNGRRQRRPPAEGAGTDDGGEPQRRVSVRPGRGWSL